MDWITAISERYKINQITQDIEEERKKKPRKLWQIKKVFKITIYTSYIHHTVREYILFTLYAQSMNFHVWN